MGATSTASGRLEVNLFLLSEKRGGNSHFGTFLVSAVLHSQPFAATYIYADKAGS